MRRIRFTIASLLMLVLFVAVGFAALRESNDLWDSGVLTVTLAALLISILLAVHRTESRRAFWLGFAFFGWIYLVLSLVPSIESRLMTTKGLAYLDSKVPGRSSELFTIRFCRDRLWHRPTIRSRMSPSPQTGINLPPPTKGKVRLWDAATGRLARWLERHNRELRADRTLARLPCWRAGSVGNLSPSLASFQITRVTNGG